MILAILILVSCILGLQVLAILVNVAARYLSKKEDEAFLKVFETQIQEQTPDIKPFH